MGSSSLLDQMARLCEATNGSVVGLKEVPHDEVSAYGVIDPSGELDDKVYVLRYPLRLVPPADGKPADVVEGLSDDQMLELMAAPPGRGTLSTVGTE